MCTAAFATHTFPAGETTERVWPIRAELEPTRLGDVAGTPVPKGVYRVRVAFQPFTVATTESAGVPGPVHEAVIEGALRVR